MELITLKTFETPIEAHILRSKLESENIDAFVFDEHSVGINQFLSNAIGGVKVKIKEEDTARAMKVLDEINATDYTNDLDEIIVCPKCGSKAYYSYFKSMKGRKGLLSLLSSILFWVYPIYYKNVFKCKKCEEEFDGLQ
ncbi:DUF2007 domain-containing protein [uncultured Empedobacter sp.]|uniref:putative signal transducing protein n=1 Tax=uncultured Empedobacter sp. TaxID=410844 RepID=UPI0026338852|nr:DUF2007 domain-containing protein [uncultured Empedobacter sp.]